MVPSKTGTDATVYVHCTLLVKLWVSVRVFLHLFFPLLLCKAENITVMVCLKTREEKVTERARKREEEGIGIEV